MIKCIIVDYERPSIDSLETLIEHFPQKLSLLATFQDAKSALEFLENNPVDLVFSDIEMKGMNGLEFADKVNGLVKIIFTTAHKEFGADSYNFNALDYLQKPIDIERFRKAIDKIPVITMNSTGTFFVKDNHKKIKIDVNEVTFIEAMQGYVRIYQNNKKESILSINTLNELEKQLKPFDFFRIHNSHMVYMPYITSFDASYVELNLGSETKSLPISNTYRNQFLKAMPILGK